MVSMLQLEKDVLENVIAISEDLWVKDTRGENLIDYNIPDRKTRVWAYLSKDGKKITHFTVYITPKGHCDYYEMEIKVTPTSHGKAFMKLKKLYNSVGNAKKISEELRKKNETRMFLEEIIKNGL